MSASEVSPPTAETIDVSSHAAASTDILAEGPAKALDPLVSEPSILEKAREMAKPYFDAVDQTARPYVEKVTATTRPYTDAAFEKAQGLVERTMEGVSISGPQSSTTGEGIAEKARSPGIQSTSSTTASESTPLTGSAGEKGDLTVQARGLFGHVTSAVQNTFTQLTQTIEEKTASPSHPGVITQVTNAVQQGAARVDAFIDQKTGAPGVSSGLGSEVKENPAIQTTTNTSERVNTDV